MVINPSRFVWTDRAWRGPGDGGQVIYEMHAGTFTEEGTWRAAALRLPELRDLGVTLVEMLPVAEFPGRFGWGYDGVDFFAPTRLYGEPDDLRAFVDRAHALGLGVLLDVVYNHVGPDGCYLEEFSSSYFSRRHGTEWGKTFNFDDHGSPAVRELVVENAAYWIREFHFDGLRLDATEHIYDDSEDHVLAELARKARAAASGRGIFLVAEDEPQRATLLRPPFDFDAAWSDDFHHAAHVALTGKREGYYASYRGAPQELVSCAKRGFLYQGQTFPSRNARRGAATGGLAPRAFVTFLENHNQVSNSLRGERLADLASPARARAMTAFFLLAPGTPMLFQGQERGVRTPFVFFADHEPELAQRVREGRFAFLSSFASLGRAEARARLPDPSSEEAFRRCKLGEGGSAETFALHKDLLALRRSEAALTGACDGAVLTEQAFVLRFFHPAGDRLVLVNLGPEASLVPSEPLLARSGAWELLFSSEDPRYGGSGTLPIEPASGAWHLPAACAVLLGGPR